MREVYGCLQLWSWLGWGWLPLSIAMLYTVGLLVTYTMAVVNGHVAPLLPYQRYVHQNITVYILLLKGKFCPSVCMPETSPTLVTRAHIYI